MAILVLAAAVIAAPIRPAEAQLAIDVPKSGAGGVLATIVFDDGQKVDVDVPTTVGDNETTIAANIAKAINAKKPNSATPSGNKVNIPNTKDIEVEPKRGKDSSLTVSVDTKLGMSGLVPTGIFGFAPSLVDGGTISTAPLTVTVGFTGGLAPISFDQPAGTSISALASALDFSLSSAGYTSQLVGPNDVEVFGVGAVLPADFFEIAAPIGSGDLGVALHTQAIPEPASLLLMGSVLMVLAFMCPKKGAFGSPQSASLAEAAMRSGWAG
jgi:hypothetical protein